MSNPLTRRQTLASAAALAAACAVPARPATRAAAQEAGPFAHGVASGDADHHSLVIWTRISGVEGSVAVDWEVSAQADFADPLAAGRIGTSARRDHTVKVLVSGLEPGADYFYRFRHAGLVSPTGRSKTLPAGALSTLTLAVVSCSNFPFGHFNVYDAIALDDSVEWVLHLGDYLYEYGSDGWGGAMGRQLRREHRPAREIVSLDDYRQRHAQYKADPLSQRMHARHPLLVIWDDHEVTNNPWRGGAQNHQPDSEGPWQARRRAALRAWFEWMPVRDPQPGHRREDYWRHWRFGDLASLVALETRHSGRAEQIEYSAHIDEETTPAQAAQFLNTVLAAEDRPMLSAAMREFLQRSLSEARRAQRPWTVLANQIPMARTHYPPLDARLQAQLMPGLEPASRQRLAYFARMGELNLPLYLDPWDGYPKAREALYASCRALGIRDLLVLTGDSHSFWSNRLFDDAGRPMGLELGVAGVSSPGDFAEFGAHGAAALDRRLAEHNHEVLWTEGRYNGYLRVTLERGLGRADYLIVDTVLDTRYRLETLRSVALRPVAGRLRYGKRVR